MADLDIHVRQHTVLDLIKTELGFNKTISYGATGRGYYIDWHDGKEKRAYPEFAAFDLLDVLDRAEVLFEDDLIDAAVEGIRAMLKRDQPVLYQKIQETADAMHAELLAAPADIPVYPEPVTDG